MTTAQPLNGITVIAAGHDTTAALLVKLLVDLGARAIPVGERPPPTGGFERWLRTGLAPSAGWDEADRLLDGADVLVCDARGGDHLATRGLDPRGLLDAYPELVTVRLSAFGLTGPLRDAPATERTLQSLAGLTAATGAEGGPTVTSTVGLASRTAALSGLIAVTAQLIGRTRGAGGDYWDIAEFDSLLTHVGTILPSVALAGRPPRRTGNRHGMAAPWNIYPCRDAPVVVCTMGETMWRRLATLAGRPELVDDPRFTDTAARVRHADELDAVLGEWTAGHQADTLVALLRAKGIPSARIATADDVRRSTAARRRGLTTDPLGEPGSPLRSLVPTVHTTGSRPRQGRLWEPIPRGSPPLRGVRLLEVGSYTAGPHAGRLLAQLGADVLKVEPPQGEGSRHLAQRVGSVGYLYVVNNAGKRSCRLDLGDPGDRSTFDGLIADSDILLTNLAADTLAAGGIAPEQILPRHAVVHCAVTGHGLAAADRSVDTVIQAESGVMHLVGGATGTPQRTPVSSADVLGAYLAAAAATVASYVRLRTGAGAAADVALFDAAVWATQDRWFDDVPAGAPQLVEAEDGTVIADTDRPLPEAGGPVSVVVEAAAAAGLPAAPLHDLTQVVRHPQVRARRMVVEQTCAGTTVLITGNHLRSLLRGAPAPALAPVDRDEPGWLAPTTIEGQG
ncbi:CoA transferase [Streptomyces netropsis]|uniref:CoA transferase n=1 Tax=Streptomyces netropsis TaxID=55404 RepID=UPI0030CBB298